MEIHTSIIGHSSIVRFLSSSLKNNRLGHAYIFLGPDGIGKRTVALFFSQLINCQNRNESNSCGSCQSCQQFKKGSHPDFFEVKREFDEKAKKLKKNISLEQIQALQSILSQRSWSEGKKIVLISGAENLSDKAANALLKTLEEPKGAPVIILTARHDTSVPATILSRCQTITFYPVSDEEIIEAISETKAPSDTLRQALALSFGRPGRVLELIQGGDQLTDHIESQREAIKLMREPIHSRFSKIAKQYPFLNRTDPEKTDKTQNILDNYALLVRDLMLVKQGCRFLVSNQAVQNEIEALSTIFTLPKLTALMHTIFQGKKFLHHNINAKTTIENFIIHM